MRNSTPLITSDRLGQVPVELRRRARIASLAIIIVPVVLLAAVLTGQPWLLVTVLTFSAAAVAGALATPTALDYTAYVRAAKDNGGYAQLRGRVTAVVASGPTAIITVAVANGGALRLSTKGFGPTHIRLNDDLTIQLYPSRWGRQVAVSKTASDGTVFAGFGRLR